MLTRHGKIKELGPRRKPRRALLRSRRPPEEDMVQDNGYDGYETYSNKGRLDKARRRPKKPVRDWEEVI